MKEKRFYRIRRFFSGTPALGWLLGAFGAVLLESLVGDPFSEILGLPKIPVLFGVVIMLKKPALIPGAFAYVLLIYAIPVILFTRITAKGMNWMADKLDKMPLWFSAALHLLVLYFTLDLWAQVSDYRLLLIKLMLIAIMLTLSLNVINGYMGEFSCSHPGFMALGAYVASVFTVGLFMNDRLFGHALLPAGIGQFLFPIGLILAGAIASIGALVVAIPSFRTRGDYLAIISLAFMFIVKSLIENLEVVGGPRGLSGQPDWATLPTVYEENQDDRLHVRCLLGWDRRGALGARAPLYQPRDLRASEVGRGSGHGLLRRVELRDWVDRRCCWIQPPE